MPLVPNIANLATRTATEFRSVRAAIDAIRRVQGSGGAAGSGPLRVWTGTATSNGDGNWSVNYTAAGFTAPPVVTATAVSPTTDTVQDRAWATLTGVTATGASGYTIRGNLIVSLLIGGGVTTRTAGGTAVHVQAIGV